MSRMSSAVLGLRAAQDRKLFVSPAGHDGNTGVAEYRSRAGGIPPRQRRSSDARRGAVRTSSRVYPGDEAAVPGQLFVVAAYDCLHRQRSVRLAGGGILRRQRVDGDLDSAVADASV